MIQQFRDLIANCLTTHSIVEVEQGRSFPLNEREAAYAAMCIVDHTRIPWLCPDCKGKFHPRPVNGSEDDCGYCSHPKAPTLADAIALWEAVHDEPMDYGSHDAAITSDTFQILKAVRA